MIRKYKVKEEGDISTEKEKLKQKIQAKVQRILRYDKISKLFRQNKLSKSNPRIFYRELGNKILTIEDPPSAGEVERLWKTILEDDKHHNERAGWIREQEEMCRYSSKQEWTDITNDKVTRAMRKTSNWKSPSIDNVPNFWLKNFETLHEDIVRCYNKLVSRSRRDTKMVNTGNNILVT